MSPSRKAQDDAALFAAVMRDAAPLRKKKRPLMPLPEPESPPPRPVHERPAFVPAPPAPKASPNPGIDRRTAERLRKGAMEIDRRLDLHGMTEAAAHAALDRFVRQAWQDGVRVLLIITGKGSVGSGGGVLRRNLPRWLASGEHAARVLRVSQAQLRHGGAGAYYVLLRRDRTR